MRRSLFVFNDDDNITGQDWFSVPKYLRRVLRKPVKKNFGWKNHRQHTEPGVCGERNTLNLPSSSFSALPVPSEIRIENLPYRVPVLNILQECPPNCNRLGFLHDHKEHGGWETLYKKGRSISEPNKGRVTRRLWFPSLFLRRQFVGVDLKCRCNYELETLGEALRYFHFWGKVGLHSTHRFVEWTQLLQKKAR